MAGRFEAPVVRVIVRSTPFQLVSLWVTSSVTIDGRWTMRGRSVANEQPSSNVNSTKPSNGPRALPTNRAPPNPYTLDPRQGWSHLVLVVCNQASEQRFWARPVVEKNEVCGRIVSALTGDLDEEEHVKSVGAVPRGA